MRDDIQEVLKQLRQRLEIDEYALEKECRDHAILYAEIGELHTNAKSDASTAKKDLDFLQDDLDKEIRLDPEKHDITKVTEGAILSTIRRDKKWRRLFEEHLDKQQIANHYSVLLSAAEQRKSMLRDCKDLFIYNYYSTIGLDKEAKEIGRVSEKKYMKFKKEKHEREREADSRSDQGNS